jgi:hypothetical protein
VGGIVVVDDRIAVPFRLAEALGIQLEALLRALDHARCRQDFGLPDRRCRLDIDNDRVVGIDELVGRAGEEGRCAVRRCPLRCRIGGATNFGVTSLPAPNAASSRTARYSSAARPAAFGGTPRGPFDAIVVAGVGLDQTDVDRKAFATDHTLGNAACKYALEQTPQQVTFPKPAVAVLREVE